MIIMIIVIIIGLSLEPVRFSKPEVHACARRGGVESAP
jgi:hypothetical protein